MKINFPKLTGLFALLLFAFAALPGAAQVKSWSQFLGPNRDGISDETGLMDSWPEKGPKTVWKTKIGGGMSGIAVNKGVLFSMAQDGKNQYVLAVSAKSGAQVWRSVVSPRYENSMGDGPRATPTVHEGHVYAFGGDGILACRKEGDGAPVWTVDTIKKSGTKIIDYGMASSPLIVGDNVVVQVGGTGSAVMAFDAKSGELQWKSCDGTAGYSSPAIRQIGKEKHLVAFTGKGVWGMNSETGKELWRFSFPTDYDCNTSTPVSVDGKLLISSGENHGSVLLDIKKIDGQYVVEEVWESLGARSALRSEWQTPILKDGFLYGLDNVGSAGPVTNLVCVEAKSGKQIWSKKRFGKSNMIAADGKLFVTTKKGELVVVQINSEKFVELGRGDYFDDTRQAPALFDGHLYIRGLDSIVCVDVRQQ